MIDYWMLTFFHLHFHIQNRRLSNGMILSLENMENWRGDAKNLWPLRPDSKSWMKYFPRCEKVWSHRSDSLEIKKNWKSPEPSAH